MFRGDVRMKKIIGLSLCVLLLGYSVHRLKTMEKSNESETAPTTSGLLIFLDDNEKDQLGAVSDNFLAAFNQEAGPIIVSASVINNIRKAKKPDEKDPYRLKQIAGKIQEKSLDSRSPEENKKLKDIIVSPVNFDSNTSEKWVLKEINPWLYLLLPKNYLENKNISVDEATEFSFKAPLTPTELMIGFKINHMKTVTHSDIKSPQTSPEFADYFSTALSAIFVTNSEYSNLNKKLIPLLSIYIMGHGWIKDRICGLSIEQFKNFVNFLEKIQTRILIYTSCYAAGTNAVLMYKDASSGIDKTYPFALVTTTLTDSITYGRSIDIKLNRRGQLSLDTEQNYKAFIQAITTPDIIDYSSAIKHLSIPKEISTTPQIKYPGLPWFSVLDRGMVASIGSVMAKTRTKPLNIATFFAEKGKKNAEPRGILLYAQDIPFEIIINTKNATGPTFVSMIPGDTVHRVKKISSTVHRTDDILNSFYIEGLMPHKIFVIDEIQAPFSDSLSRILTHNNKDESILTNVIVETRQHIFETSQNVYNTYFTYNGKIYQAKGENPGNPFALVNSLDEQIYKDLLKPRSLTQIIDDLKAHAKTIFAKKMTSSEAQKEVIDLLNSLPNNTVLHLPKISFISGNLFAASDFMRALNKYSSTNRKLLWFDQLWIENKTIPEFTDVILDIMPQETRILNKQKEVAYLWPNLSEKQLKEDYVPTYKQLFNYFDKHMTLPEPFEGTKENIEKKSIQQLLTPESIAKIKTVQEGKVGIALLNWFRTSEGITRLRDLLKIKDNPEEKVTAPATSSKESPKPKVAAPTETFMSDLRAQAKTTFKQAMAPDEAEKKVLDLLNTIPNNGILRIPHITISLCSDSCWQNFIDNVAKYHASNARKILWIERSYNERQLPQYTDIIIDIRPKETRIFTKDYKKRNPKTIALSAGKSTPTSKNLTEDYAPIYEKMIQSFNEPLARTLESELENLVNR